MNNSGFNVQTQTKDVINGMMPGAYQAYHFTIDTDSIATHLMKERPSLGSQVEYGRVPPILDADAMKNSGHKNRYDVKYAENPDKNAESYQFSCQNRISILDKQPWLQELQVNQHRKKPGRHHYIDITLKNKSSNRQSLDEP